MKGGQYCVHPNQTRSMDIHRSSSLLTYSNWNIFETLFYKSSTIFIIRTNPVVLIIQSQRTCVNGNYFEICVLWPIFRCQWWLLSSTIHSEKRSLTQILKWSYEIGQATVVVIHTFFGYFVHWVAQVSNDVLWAGLSHDSVWKFLLHVYEIHELSINSSLGPANCTSIFNFGVVKIQLSSHWNSVAVIVFASIIS